MTGIFWSFRASIVSPFRSRIFGLLKQMRQLWPVGSDLAKFHHFGTILKVLGNFLGFWDVLFGKLLILRC